MSGEVIPHDPGAVPTVAEAQGDPLLTMIARAAADPATDIAKFERLMSMYNDHLEREAHRAYTAAMAEMQPELPEIEEHGEILDKQGEVQSRYARWEDQQAAIKPILAKHGFSLTFSSTDGDNKIAITAKLAHRAGHVEATSKELPLDTSGSKNLVQSHGSTVSYGQRYTAKLLLNLTSRGEDDDGVAAGTKLISDAQAEALQLLIERAGADTERFCKFLKVPSLDQLPARRYRFAERALMDAAAKRQSPRSPP